MEDLSGIHMDFVAVCQRGRVADGDSVDKDRAVRLEDLEGADLFFVIAGDAEEEVASRARGEKDVVLVEEARVV
jgi:hypothetical protein